MLIYKWIETGNFEVIKEGITIVTGMIRVSINLTKGKIFLNVIKVNVNNEEEVLDTIKIFIKS